MNCILLVDDNPEDNFFHQRIINKTGLVSQLFVKDDPEAALTFIKNEAAAMAECPGIILLDMHMPGMNGWEFVDAYNQVEHHIGCRGIVLMLQPTSNPKDRERAANTPCIIGTIEKPITAESFTRLIEGLNVPV